MEILFLRISAILTPLSMSEPKTIIQMRSPLFKQLIAFLIFTNNELDFGPKKNLTSFGLSLDWLSSYFSPSSWAIS
jgi:hypothetical protein